MESAIFGRLAHDRTGWGARKSRTAVTMFRFPSSTERTAPCPCP